MLSLTDQSVDGPLLDVIKKIDNLSKYLRASWGLSKGDRFHELKF
jgi:large subunit ribosomal protein L6e